jgi:hypothetical protein
LNSIHRVKCSTYVHYEVVLSTLIWPEKWAETSHFCKKVCCAWRNSSKYICWSQRNGNASHKEISYTSRIFVLILISPLQYWLYFRDICFAGGEWLLCTKFVFGSVLTGTAQSIWCRSPTNVHTAPLLPGWHHISGATFAYTRVPNLIGAPTVPILATFL